MTTIRPASTSDAAALSVIAQTSKRHWGYPEPWLEAWAAVLTITPDYVQENTLLVADRDGVPVAFVGLVDDGTDWQLDHLWVLPEHQGHGLGSQLFDAALEVVRARRPGLLRIEAEPYALGFYERCGARQVGTIPAPVLGTPRELPLLELTITPT
jgi:ribosomal protein S18 acetylase RimI-like enzyme